MKKIWLIVIVAMGLLVACSTPADLAAEVDPTVIGGVDAEPHEFPFMVNSEARVGSGVALCGGAIISKDWVITAAHCVDEGGTVSIIAGNHSRSTQEESEQRIEVENVIIADDDDAALLELSEPLELNDKVQPIAYASTMPADGSEVTAIGWGATSIPNGSGSDILQKVGLILDLASGCFGDDSLLCTTRSVEKGVGPGDSGGPIFKDGKLLGVASFISEDRAFYAKIPSFIDWIEEQTGIAPDGGGETDPPEPEPAPEPEPEPDPDTTTFEDTLAEGDVVLQPDDTFFELEGAATLSGTLSGPEDANFDLFLYEWDGDKWVQAARGGNPDSSEDLNYEAEAGYYAWLLYARQGNGDYTLSLTNAAR